MKIAFITDLHLRDTTPRNRLDNAYKVQFEKLEEVAEICEDYGVNMLVEGGDLFDSHRPSHKLLTDLIDWTQYKLSCPFYGIVGNHDITGFNLDSHRQSGLGVMFASGALIRLDTAEFESEKVLIKAVDVSAHVETHYDKEYVIEDRESWKKIIVSHNYIIPAKSMPYGFVHPKDVETNADIVLCGHNHVPFEYKSGKTTWINPGSLCRWRTSDTHRPKILIIDTKDMSIYEQFLASGLPAQMVFDFQTIDAEKKYKFSIESFAKSLEETSFNNINIEDLVKKAGNENDIPKECVDLVLKKVQEAKEVLS